MSDYLTQTFKTPGGNDAVMSYRDGTSDWNTIAACLKNPLADTGDEYHIPSGLSGWALDVGAHVGSVTVGLLLDNPGLKVVSVEGVGENFALVQRNVEQNGLTERAYLVHAAAWSGHGSIEIEYGYTGNETAEVHQFIGSVSAWMDLPPGGTKKSERVPIFNLNAAVKLTGGQGFVWAKSDCEGCEHRFFKGVGLRKVDYLIGEWHNRDGTPESFTAQLSTTHDVTWHDGDGFGGPFEAVRRG